MNNFNQPNEKHEHLYGICQKCGAAIYSENELAQSSLYIKCKTCHDKELAEARKKEHEEKKKKERTLEQAKKSVLKILIITAVIFVILTVTACVVNFKNTLYIIPGAVILYLATVQFLWGTEPISSIFLFFLRAPKFTFGLIFELSLDGCLMFILVKIALWILGALLAVISFVLGITISSIIALFTFPFSLYKAIRHPEELDFFF